MYSQIEERKVRAFHYPALRRQRGLTGRFTRVLTADNFRAGAGFWNAQDGNGRMLIKRNPKRDLKVRRTRAQQRDSARADQVREFYTVSQLADLLQLTEMTIYRMVNRAELPCYAIGRVKRFRHRDIEEFLDSCRIPAAKPAAPPIQAQHQMKVRRGSRVRAAASKTGPAEAPARDSELEGR
jgi:excisionase family DNA binding protein